MRKGLLSGLLIVALVIILANAHGVQGSLAAATKTPTPPPPKAVSIKMEDGLEIKGDFYDPQNNGKGPAALLLHQYGGSSYDWKDFANLLKQKGYSVLAVDMRGQGLTAHKQDWKMAQQDTLALMAWLREQPGVDPAHVIVMGASIGANLALKGCADDDACHVAVALSPGLNFYGVVAKDAITKMKGKAIFMAAAALDAQSGEATKLLAVYAPTSVNVMTRIYASLPTHGMGLLAFNDLTSHIMEWLDKYNS